MLLLQLLKYVKNLIGKEKAEGLVKELKDLMNGSDVDKIKENTVNKFKININVKAYSAEIYVSDGYDNVKALDIKIENNKKVEVKERVDISNKPLEEMNIDELHQVILDKMAKNGNVTEYMKKTVYDNNHKPSLINWAKSFR